MVIQSFKHRGLIEIYEGKGGRRVVPEHVQRLRRILAVLDQSRSPADMDLPGFRMHALSGQLKGHYAVRVSANWRVIVRFEEGHATDVDYTDYH